MGHYYSAEYHQEKKKIKRCPSCHQDLIYTKFSKSSFTKDGRAGHCKECRKLRYPYKASSHKIHHLFNRYGLEWEQYLDLFEKQNKQCLICSRSINLEGTAHVDHCHKTKLVRGLLCGNCNKGIGLLQDDPMLLQKAKEYLENS